MRLPAYLALPGFLSVVLTIGCAKTAVIEGGAGLGIGGSGGSGGPTSGGPTSGGPTSGTPTSGAPGPGSGGPGSGGGSGGSGGSGAITKFPNGTPHLASDTPATKPLQGLVNGGRSRAVVGARVYVFEESPSGYGEPARSLLTSATGNPSDSIGHYVLTGPHGGFSIAGDYTCTVGRSVYLYVRGGNSGDAGANSAIGLMASLGACPEAGDFTSAEPFVFVNEVTTVAAAYAMSDRAVDPTHVSRPGSAMAFADAGSAALLARVATGVANSAVPSHPGTTVPQSKINTLANILSACINSSGPTSPGCATLFANARSGGPSGMIPDDTAAAVINIAHNPRGNTATLHSLQPAQDAPFQPSLNSAPEDFTIRVASDSQDKTIALVSPHRTVPR